MTAARQLLGLTLWRPWPILIARGIKRIENRPWRPEPRLLPGEWLAIHAGKTYDPDCSPLAVSLGIPPETFFDRKLGAASSIVAVARFAGVVTESKDTWFFGPFGWVLDQVVALDPIPCKGAQGLWVVPRDIAERCRAAYRAQQLSRPPAGQEPAQP
jgi:hypothetical protein